MSNIGTRMETRRSSNMFLLLPAIIKLRLVSVIWNYQDLSERLGARILAVAQPQPTPGPKNTILVCDNSKYILMDFCY